MDPAFRNINSEKVTWHIEKNLQNLHTKIDLYLNTIPSIEDNQS